MNLWGGELQSDNMMSSVGRLDVDPTVGGVTIERSGWLGGVVLPSR